MKDFEHEGDLNDTDVKRARDMREAEARKILYSDLNELTENDAFLRWFGKFAHPALTQDFSVNNGSNLAQFMGRRQIVIQMMADMDLAAPGFMLRMLTVREQYERRLEAATRKEQ